MAISYKIIPNLLRKLKKISKKDIELSKQILNKIDEIINCEKIEHYKNLRNAMKDYKRVHVGHFVLVFRFDKKEGCVYFSDFEHHDKIYN